MLGRIGEVLNDFALQHPQSGLAKEVIKSKKRHLHQISQKKNQEIRACLNAIFGVKDGLAN